MEIRTITCHDVYNAGASLQAYALVTYLRGLGHDARIIDYKPDYLSGHFRLWGIGNPRYDRPGLRAAYLLAKLPGRLKARYSRRKRRYDAFRRDYLPLTKRYDSLEALQSDPPAADVFVAGSDQIWNTLFQNGRDAAFYLAFAPNESVKASYAASFAMDAADEAWKERQSAWLKELDFISVRERSGVDILTSLGVSDGMAVLDPVFLLDKPAWQALSAERCCPEPYVLVYDFDGNGQIEQEARRLANAYGCKIVTLQKLGYADRVASDAGPREFLSLIRYADFVLSNSFHATAFSLIFQRPFMVFDRKEKLNSRMRDLVKSVGLDGRKAADEYIDWKDVQCHLAEQISMSKAYIDRVLESVK